MPAVISRGRRSKPGRWDWSLRGLASDCRWSVDGLVLAWPFWDTGDHKVAIVPIASYANRRIVHDPITGNHGDLATNAGSANTLLELSAGVDPRYGITQGLRTFVGGTERQCMSQHMRDFPTTQGTFVYHLRKLDATNRVAAHYANYPTPSPFGKLIALCTPLEFSGTNARFYFGGNTAGTDLLVQGGLTYGNDIWIFTCGPRGMEIWQNGIRVGLLATTPTRTNDPTDRFGFLGGDGVNTGFSNDLCETGVCLVYNRQLSFEEIKALSVDPWTPFRKDYRRPASLAGAGLPELVLDGDGVIMLQGSGDIDTPAEIEGTGTIQLVGTASIGSPAIIAGDGVIALAGAADIEAPAEIEGTGTIQIIGSGLIFPLEQVPPGGGGTDPDALPDADCSREFQADFETENHGLLGTSTERRPDAISPSYLEAYAPGPVDQQDLSEGYEARTWRARVDGVKVYLARSRIGSSGPTFVDEIELLDTTGGFPLREIDLCFDSTGRAVIVGERFHPESGSDVVVSYFEDAFPARVLTSMGPGRTPRCCLDLMPPSNDPDICPPPPEAQVVFIQPDTGMVRRQETENYTVDHASPLLDTGYEYILGFYATRNHRMRVAYVVRDPETGTYSPVLFHDSMPYLTSRLANPSLPSVFVNLVFDEGQLWRNPGTPGAVDVVNLRVGLPDTIRAVEVGAADADFSIATGWQEQVQVNDAEIVIGPGATYPAGGFVDFPFTITHGGGTMSPRAFRARTMRIVDGEPCYSPWSYWFAGRQAINLVVTPGAEDTGLKTQVMTWASSDGGMFIQYREVGTFRLIEEYIPGIPSTATRTCQQVFDPSIVGGWRTVFRCSVINREDISFSDLHDSYGFTLHSRVATEASSDTPLGEIPGPPFGGLQSPGAFPPLP